MAVVPVEEQHTTVYLILQGDTDPPLSDRASEDAGIIGSLAETPDLRDEPTKQ